MSLFRATIAPFLAAIALAAAAPAHAQSAADMSGYWSGKIETPQGELTFVLHVREADDGALAAEGESPDQAPGRRIPVDAIAVENEVLTFRIDLIRVKFAGKWDPTSNAWVGTFNQGIDMPLTLARGGPEAKPVIEGLDGRWDGSIEVNGVKLRLFLRIVTGEHGTNVTLSSPDQMANDLPIGNFTREGQSIRFAYTPGQQSFAGSLADDGETISGTWNSALTKPTPVVFTRTSATAERLRAPNRPQLPTGPFPYKVEEASFDNPDFEDVSLVGTLTLPEGEGPFPAAVLISGSGPQDRDETIMGHKPFAVIADHLTRHGIAVLRYDDRGVGASTGNYSTATSADLATDANAAARFLMSRADIRQDEVGFIGHSEGGMIGPIAMADNPDIAFLVMLAGVGTAPDELLLTQRRLIFSQMGLSDEMLDQAEPVMTSIFGALSAADTFAEGRKAARALLTPDALTTIAMPADSNPELLLNQIATPWFHYFVRYDPAPNLQRIGVPVLALNGSLDLQVEPKGNLAAIKAALAHNRDATTMELEGLNHLFQSAKTGSPAEYAEIEETFSPKVLEIVSDWIAERFKVE